MIRSLWKKNILFRAGEATSLKEFIITKKKTTGYLLNSILFRGVTAAAADAGTVHMVLRNSGRNNPRPFSKWGVLYFSFLSVFTYAPPDF